MLLRFGRTKSDVPTIQIAFQYSVVVPPQELSNSGGVSTNRYGNKQNIRLTVRLFFCCWCMYGCFQYFLWQVKSNSLIWTGWLLFLFSFTYFLWMGRKYVSSKFDSLFFDPGFSCATGVSVYSLISNSKTISMLVSKIFQDN